MSIAKVEKLIDDLERKATKATKIVAKGDKLTYGDAIKLGRKSNSMISTVKKGIKEYDGAIPTDAESERILKKMQHLTTLVEEQVDALIGIKPRLEHLKVGGLVKRNLKKMGEVSEELEKIMMEKAPESLKPEAEKLAARRKVAFDKGNNAFAGLTGGEDNAEAEGEDDSD
ncbi:uncharacterized protein PV09_04661 [Verruconis gallopava]|uniref:Uncharacterized protein n=1 Tax=Verruconis gallopava TaxID=253628 RepID=A0A0D1YUM9_9PEZI|nr:uncharacterized protein PV09_04661 [Verruconis gallopava]KIW04377.1 hypothetical protein PV09_04661 [Verruconis gallopava]